MLGFVLFLRFFFYFYSISSSYFFIQKNIYPPPFLCFLFSYFLFLISYFLFREIVKRWQQMRDALLLENLFPCMFHFSTTSTSSPFIFHIIYYTASQSSEIFQNCAGNQSQDGATIRIANPIQKPSNPRLRNPPTMTCRG